MKKNLSIVLLLIITLILVLSFNFVKNDKKEYKEVSDYSKLAILVDGVPSNSIPTDKYYYMTNNCTGLTLQWNPVEKKLKMKSTGDITVPSCILSFEEVPTEIKVNGTINNNPSGELGIESYSCEDADITYDSKLNITFNSKPSSCSVNLITWKNNNAPVLVTGMTPVKWNASNVESTTTESDSDWYDYSAKKWANVKTTDGSYWVWVPRYAYKITSGYHTGGTGVSGTIDIKFLVGKGNLSKEGIITETSGYNAETKNTSMHHFLHPAFTFGSDEVTGMWVAKYEASVNPTTDVCYTAENEVNCNKTTLIPAFKPNVKSWRWVQIGNMFEVAYNLRSKSNYGWQSSNVDTHLIKNTEWGAVAYLTQSIYGANEEVWINNSSTFTTGCAGNNVSEAAYSGCQNAYNTANGVKASTTHNITGIYDMSGGSTEYTASYVSNGNESTNGSQILSANVKYKDIYIMGTDDTQENNYTTNKNKYGNAIYETSGGIEEASWNGDYSRIPHSTYSWFLRGGYYGYGSLSGVYSSVIGIGSSNVYQSFRAVAIIP